jgi:branched-chain amino acid transport system ATP-binding protein
MLQIEQLTVHYGPLAAVRDVSLQVRAGEIVGLIGPNGAGKSTTLMTVVGVLKPAAGSISLEGRSIVGNAPERIARLGVALVPEGRRIFATLTVEENLQLGATPRRDREAVAGALERIYERFPVLRQYRSSPAGRLSGGEQQQLAIGRALLASPRLLLLDEPSLGLAPLVVDLVFDVLRGLREEGITILLVEQNAKRTVELADRTYVLRSGTVELEGTRDELLRSDVEAVYLGIGRHG